MFEQQEAKDKIKQQQEAKTWHNIELNLRKRWHLASRALIMMRTNKRGKNRNGSKAVEIKICTVYE